MRKITTQYSERYSAKACSKSFWVVSHPGSSQTETALLDDIFESKIESKN